MSLRIGRVAAVHPEDHSMDVVMIDTGERLAGVQMLAGGASSMSGTVDLPSPAMPASGDKWSLSEPTDNDMMVIIGMVGNNPIALGCLYPQVSQMLFKDPNLRVSRHSSDVYTAIDGKGNFEMAFPSGAFIRIAANPAHEDLSGKNVDESWKIAKNKDVALHIHVEQAGGKAVVDIAPSGAIVVTTESTIDATAQGDVKVATPGQVTVDAPNTTFTGNVTVMKHLSFAGGMSGSGGEGATATIQGTMTLTGGDITADNISLKGHKHSGVQTGSGTTGSAVP